MRNYFGFPARWEEDGRVGYGIEELPVEMPVLRTVVVPKNEDGADS